MEKNQHRARIIAGWGIALIATALVAAPVSHAADGDGWYPAPPTPILVDGTVTNFWAGSVTVKEYTTLSLHWLQDALLRYQWLPLSERGTGGARMQETITSAVATRGYGYRQVGTPRIATGESAGLASTLAVIDAQQERHDPRGM